MRNVEKFTSLRSIDIRFTSVTDRGLSCLKRVPTLTNLIVSGDELSEGGLKHLEEFPKLRQLSIWNCRISESGFARLRLALPDCCIEVYNDHRQAIIP